MHDERLPSSDLEEHALRAPPRMQEAVADEPGEGRVVGLADGEVDEHGRADRGACDQRVERLRERLQLGQFRHLPEVSRERAARGPRDPCGPPSRRAQFAQYFGAAEHLSAHSRAISALFVATYVPALHFFLDRRPTLGTIAHHTTAQMSRGERLRERGFAKGEGNEGNVGRGRCMRARPEKGGRGGGLRMLTVDVALPDVEELRQLAELGVERGYLTLDEVAAVLEEVESAKEQVEDFHAYLLEHGGRARRQRGRAADDEPGEGRPRARSDRRAVARLAAAVPARDRQGLAADGRAGGLARQAHRARRHDREAGDDRGEPAPRGLDREGLSRPRADASST